jgi:multidrug efflux pump subunit AcrB
MPTGTNLDTTSRILREFEEAALDLPPSEVRSVHSTAGLVITDTDWIFASSIGELWLDLVPSYERTRSLDAIMSDLRKRLVQITGPTSIELAKLNTGPPVGKAVEVKLKGKYFDELERAAAELKSVLAETDGVLDVDDDFDEGKREVRLKVDPQRAALHGLSVGQVGAAVRNAVDGVTADKMYDADEEIEVVVRLDMATTKRPEDLLRLPLLTPLGTTIALGEVAGFEMASTRGQINRWKSQRSITLSANVDENITSSVAVNRLLQEAFDGMKTRYPGVTIDFSGEFKEFQEAFAGIVQLFLFGMLLIYAILGAQFRSYVQPLVIMFTVPFAFIGAIFGLLVSGHPFSIVTMYGVVALAGIAVNDAIVMMAFINNARREGMSTVDAVVEAGRHRLRPILLTSLTTIAGLLPMALGIGGASLSWGPMANTIVWGLTVATLLTLFMIPAVYVILVQDLAEGLRRRLFG